MPTCCGSSRSTCRWRRRTSTPPHRHSQSPTSFDYYTKTAWTDRAPLMVQTRIVDSFETAKDVAVSRESIGLRANYLLQPDLRNFEAMYSTRRQASDRPCPYRRQAGATAAGRSSRSPLRALRARPRGQGPQGRRGVRPGAGSVISSWSPGRCARRPPTARRDTPYDINKYAIPPTNYGHQGLPGEERHPMVP